MRRKDIDRTSNADLIERIESEPNAVTRSVLKDVAVRRLADSDAELNRLRALNAELIELVRGAYEEGYTNAAWSEPGCYDEERDWEDSHTKKALEAIGK